MLNVVLNKIKVDSSGGFFLTQRTSEHQYNTDGTHQVSVFIDDFGKVVFRLGYFYDKILHEIEATTVVVL